MNSIPFTVASITLIFALTAEATSVPESGREAKRKLDALAQKLPGVVVQWMKQPEHQWLDKNCTCQPQVRLVRRLGPNRAKVVVLFTAYDQSGARTFSGDVVLTIWLRYYDGYWVTASFDRLCRVDPASVRTNFALLVLSIDEASEK